MVVVFDLGFGECGLLHHRPHDGLGATIEQSIVDELQQIARELLQFIDNGLLYRGSQPVMWSVVEKTALAEAEVEYDDHTSDTIWVKFPITSGLTNASVVIWTTTPWTIP